MVLGDNVFYGHGFKSLLREVSRQAVGGTVFGYRVSDPERYGVVSYDETGKHAISKKNQRQICFAVTGLYFLDNKASERARY